jgi:23S rRNA (cytidine1920-2'-O)/16S rRNA (cytidine1409-2'-O)-methyltransferase
VATPRKIRLDHLIVERELANSRQQAQGLILAGRVLVNGQKMEKCGASAEPDADISILGGAPRYVSRGGHKLEGALAFFVVNPEGKVCIDIGASTGGFTDCLLQHGARKVYAVDVGTNQLAWRIRQDPRVTCLEHTNARYLRLEQIGEPANLVTMDVSFISATLILPVVAQLLQSGGESLVLVKPQFEVGRDKVGKGGVVHEPEVQQEAVFKVTERLRDIGFRTQSCVESTLHGASGNREYFVHAIWP